MSVAVMLSCDECGRQERPKPYFRLSATGLHLQAYTRFYVDGGTVRCPEHTTAEQSSESCRIAGRILSGEAGP